MVGVSDSECPKLVEAGTDDADEDLEHEDVNDLTIGLHL